MNIFDLFGKFILAIFGNKRVLRPGEDDEKLKQILQLIANDDSDVEMSDDENEIENMDNLVQREDEINDEDLDRIPLSVLREKLRTAKQLPILRSDSFGEGMILLHLQILKVRLVNAAHSFAMVGLQNRILPCT
ncbi:unnamed protein product [Acanthoscelides obtectus]|uniref:Uncharacterized protein n=1 Tax=Acanthoscelides obtectus TaxID=200917 RepID=A0A9P0LRD6_ACAOB|nr:unnamed protein product [Acanthoscelides obtectus]CAK1657250.1 hypothetical protein AOBTE_LOCUS20246 [Acanthoscelides obtectus]